VREIVQGGRCCLNLLCACDEVIEAGAVPGWKVYDSPGSLRTGAPSKLNPC
jgi:hypothetical protein